MYAEYQELLAWTATGLVVFLALWAASYLRRTML
jgi:hypothetical protein